MKRLLLSALIATIAVACSSDDEPTDYLTVRAGLNELGGQVAVRVEQPGRTTNVTHAELANASNGSNPGVTIQTGRSGTMRILIAVLNSANDTLSAGHVVLPLQKGHT